MLMAINEPINTPTHQNTIPGTNIPNKFVSGIGAKSCKYDPTVKVMMTVSTSVATKWDPKKRQCLVIFQAMYVARKLAKVPPPISIIPNGLERLPTMVPKLRPTTTGMPKIIESGKSMSASLI